MFADARSETIYDDVFDSYDSTTINVSADP